MVLKQKNIRLRDDQIEFLKEQNRFFSFEKFVRDALDDYIELKKDSFDNYTKLKKGVKI